MNIKIDISNIISNNRRYALIYLDPENLKNVSDVVDYICETYGIINCEKYSLYEGIWYIPRNQSSHIFENVEGILSLYDDDNGNRPIDLTISNNEINLKSYIDNNEESSVNMKGFSKSKYVSCSVNEEPFSEIRNIPLNNHKNPKVNGYLKKLVESSTSNCSELNHPENINLGTTNTVGDENLCIVKEKLKIHTASKSINECIYPSKQPDISGAPELMKQDINSLKINLERAQEVDNCSDKETLTNINEPLISRYIAPFYSGSNLPLKNKLQKKDEDIFTNPEIEKDREESSQKYDIDSPEIVANSAEISSIYSFEDETSSLKRNKRKRKHNKKKKLKSFKNISLDDDNLESCNKTNFKLPLKQYNSSSENQSKGHIVFNDSEEDTQNTKKLKTKNITLVDENRSNQSSTIKSHFQTISNQNSSGTYDLGSSIKQVNFTNNKIEYDSYSDTSSNLVSNRANEANHKSNLQPPTGKQSLEELSHEIKLKFSKLITMESSLNPKIFIKNRESFQQTINTCELWNELPVCFASKQNKSKSNFDTRAMSYGQYEKIKPKQSNISNSSNIYVHNVLSDSNLVSESNCSKSFAPNLVSDSNLVPENDCNESFTPTFTGVKPSKRNKNHRYFLSVGNILQSLKKSNINNEEHQESHGSNPTAYSKNDSLLSPNLIINEEEETISNNSNDEPSNFINGNAKLSSKINISSNEDHDSNSRLQLISKCNESVKNSYEDDQKSLYNEENIIVDQTSSPETRIPCYDLENKGTNSFPFESYPFLPKLPQTGDIIATKLMTLDKNMCPSYSDYKPAKVVSVAGLKLELQILDGLNLNSEDKIIQVDWRDLKFTRLIFP